ncbi:MAG TPA: anti-sigma factor [Terriglobales bacterium]|nr:anti-sigma factor [Terriglobales bacterium]
MTCEFSSITVHGYLDGELDAIRSTEFERHLENCAECQALLQKVESLRARLQESKLYEYASPQLQVQVRKQLGLPNGATRVPAILSSRKFLAPAIAALAAVAAFLIVFFLMPQRTQTAQVTAELVDAHVRSLQPGHLTDVQSTDQHTVKPWFDGRLDFIPPVADYSSEGFPLLGGRLDVVDGHTVAGVVYGRRKHIINLFAWPARSQKGFSDASGSRQGYNWIMWRSEDMQLCLVSDVSTADLRELKNLVNR